MFCSNVKAYLIHQVAYFNVFILLLVFQMLYISINTLILLPPFLPDNCLPESFPLEQIISIVSPSSRGCFGIYASIVAALTIERYMFWIINPPM